jgi:hypothetical protein
LVDHKESPLKRVVMLCPYFPPSASVAAKRAVRFARKLPGEGWEPLFVTVEGSAGSGYDHALASALPEGLFVSRNYARSFLWDAWRRWEDAKAKARGRGEGAKRASASRVKLLDALADITYYWTPLDQFVPYLVSAAREAARIATEQGAGLIYAASNPTSTLVAGTLAGALAGLPVVLDLRDPWSLDPLHFLPKPAALRLVEQSLEQLCFTRAARVILNTERSRDAYQQRYPALAHKFVSLRNGFDEGLFSSSATLAYEGFTLVHFGSFFWHRTLAAVLRAMSKGPEEVRLVTYGTMRAEDLARTAELGLASRVESRPTVPFAEGMSVLRGAGALLLIQSEQTDLQIPAKLYDYLCARRPILALSANPEIGDILRQTGAGLSVPEREEDIAQALSRLVRGETGPIDEQALSAFSAGPQARTLAGILAEALSAPRES